MTGSPRQPSVRLVRGRPRQIAILVASVVGAITFLNRHLYYGSLEDRRANSLSFLDIIQATLSSTPETPSWVRAMSDRHFAVFNSRKFHDEVDGSVLATVREFPNARISFYKPGLRWGFEKVIEDLWPTGTEIKDVYVPQFASNISDGTLLTDLRKPRESGDMITDLILTTCDFDLLDGDYADRLEKIWLARPDEDKFRILCIRHWTSEAFIKRADFWMKRNVLTLIGLGDHIKNIFKDQVTRIYPSPLATPAETFIPIFMPTCLDDVVMTPESDSGMIDSAGMQGNLGEDHRAMNATLTQLFNYIDERPDVWGYKPPTDAVPRYVPILPSPDATWPTVNPFHLVLVGINIPTIPERFQEVIIKHHGQDYEQFFRALNGCDVILPGFHENTEYTRDKASSTIGVAGTVRTALMIDQKTSEAYGYFCPAFEVLRPNGVTEIEYIYLTRIGTIRWDSAIRSQEELSNCQQGYLDRNAEMFARGLLREITNVTRQ